MVGPVLLPGHLSEVTARPAQYQVTRHLGQDRIFTVSWSHVPGVSINSAATSRPTRSVYRELPEGAEWAIS